jgi:hypothetical protein
MGKATKAEALVRLREVTKLLLAGAEFAEIRQFATDRQWGITDRSVRRYMEIAYKEMVDVSKRNRKELLGRHLMQRRALYARCLKQGDHRTALNVLKDEADLQGLYPPTKIAPTTPDGNAPYSDPALSRRERLVRILVAEKSGDKTQLQLLEETTRYRTYRFPDTQLPSAMLNVMALLYVGEQLEHATMCLLALWNTVLLGDEDGAWDRMAMCGAYRFKIGRDAWRQFTEKVGIDGDHLVRGNYQGLMLEMCGENICDLAPSAEEMRASLAASGQPVDDLISVEALRKSWHQMFAGACAE